MDSHTLSLSQSITHSPTNYLTHSLTHFLIHYLSHLLAHSLPLSPTHSLSHSLSRSLSFTHCLTHSLTGSLFHISTFRDGQTDRQADTDSPYQPFASQREATQPGRYQHLLGRTLLVPCNEQIRCLRFVLYCVVLCCLLH